MKKILIITPGYPSNDNIYNNAFVHSRVKQYKKNDIDVVIFSINKNNNNNYIYDGFEILQGDYNKLTLLLKKHFFSKIIIHFGFKKTLQTVVKTSPDSKLLIWVHGVEALGWYRRLFVFDIKRPYRFLGYIYFNTLQLMYMNRFVRNTKIDKTFIFVSEWMKNILEKDSFSKGKINQYKIIPNVIDNKVFNYVEKTKKQRLNILSIRPYASKKYANDLSVKTVLELSKKPFFYELNFSFYGDGKLFYKTLKPIKHFSNVKIFQKFLSHQEIAKIHKKNGIMLIPTRQDAQGVSMCEAMSSGLIPLTSKNTAIPEFVSEKCGYLTKNYKELANAIEEIYYNHKLFFKKSENSSKFIQKKCSPEIVIKKELDVILK